MSITWSYVGRAPGSMPLIGYAEIERDPVTNDIKLPVRIVRGPAAVIQRVRQRFQMGLREWFLDQQLGLPFYEDVFVKNPDIGQVTSIFRNTLVSTPGISSLISMSTTLDLRMRNLSVNFEARAEDPSIIIRAVDAPFKIR